MYLRMRCEHLFDQLFPKYWFLKVSLSQSTLFSPLADLVAQSASKIFQSSKTHTVLLIITVDKISDMDDTFEKLVVASHFPLSIIIIKVIKRISTHWNDWTLVKNLQTKRGDVCNWDIVQFVAFRNYFSSPSDFTREVLFEIPEQVHDFCCFHWFIQDLE